MWNVLRRELPRLRRRRFTDAHRRRFGDTAVNVLAGDAPIAARALDAGGIDSVLLERAAN
jgi:hypothetical protein